MKDLYFGNKTILVTGGVRGIGQQVADLFGSRDANVIIADKDQESLLKLKEHSLSCNKTLQADYQYLDLTSEESCQNLIDYVREKYGTIHTLVNNARGGSRASVESEGSDNWNLTFDVNLKGAFFLSRLSIDLMKSSGTRGNIINMSSVSGSFVSSESPSYQLSKAALEQLTRILAVSAGKFGIRVNAIAPGFIVQKEHEGRFNKLSNKTWKDTAIHSVSLDRIGSSLDVANAVLFLASDLSSFITGQVIGVDGGGYIHDPFHLLYSKPEVD
jgi:3-oxoacyl-[acyl-carrier protein] reductase|tara:strand:+ start:9829 stop:10644 length:816 start_codon:yes stop_codon:yes gene_type:complete